MKFHDREEISRLQEIEQASRNNAQLTVVTGRRRIGKTQLILKSTESVAEPALYFLLLAKRIISTLMFFVIKTCIFYMPQEN